MDDIKAPIIGGIRYAAVYVVGTMIAFVLSTTGVDLSQFGETLEHAFTFVFGVAYYLAVRIGSKWIPALEWLLIVPKAPVYVPPSQLAVAKRNTKNLK